jgi:hypothetical protein
MFEVSSALMSPLFLTATSWSCCDEPTNQPLIVYMLGAHASEVFAEQSLADVLSHCTPIFLRDLMIGKNLIRS